jgi:hypothetical protein
MQTNKKSMELLNGCDNLESRYAQQWEFLDAEDDKQDTIQYSLPEVGFKLLYKKGKYAQNLIDSITIEENYAELLISDLKANSTQIKYNLKEEDDVY